MRKQNALSCLIRDRKKVLFAIAVGMISTLAMIGGFSWLIHKEMISREHIHIIAAIVLIAGSFLGGLSTGRGEGKLLRCIAAGGGMMLIWLLINLVLFDSKLNGILPGTVVVLGGTAAAVLLEYGSTGKRRKQYRLHKYHNR